MANSDESGNLLNDAFSSAKDLITERFSSPFIFSYIISWLFIHYETMILVFTDTSDELTIQDKLDLINTNITNTYISIPLKENVLLSGYTWALIAACFYTFLYPFFDYLITRFTLDRKVAIRNLRVIAENKIVFSAEDVNKIYVKQIKVEADLKSRIENSEITENQLRVQVEELMSKIAAVETKKLENQSDVNLSSSIKSVKKLIELSPPKESQSIKKRTSISQTSLDSLIDSLAKVELQGVMVLGEVAVAKKSIKTSEFVRVTSSDSINSLVKKGIVNIKTDLSNLEKTVFLTPIGNQIYKSILKAQSR